MNEELLPSDREQQMRKQAESRLKALDAELLGEKSPEEIRQLVHELQVHQVELEMQQEELYITNYALKESEERYRHLYLFAPNGYFTVNRYGSIIEVNFAAARLLGVDRRIVAGNLMRSFIQVKSRADFDDFFSNLQYHHDVHRCEVCLLTHSGELRTVILEGAGLGEKPSKNISFLITAIDITDRKKAEMEVILHKNLLEKVMGAIMSGMVVFDSVRNEQGEIVDFVYRLANPVVERIAGRSLVGLRYLELYPGVKMSGLFDKLKSVVETGKHLDIEQYYQGEGFAHWFRIIAVPLENGIVSSVEDVTSRKRLEAENLQMRMEGQKQLLDAILDAQEEERRRISESLHNGVGQTLYATKLNLERIDFSKLPLSVEELQEAKQKTQQLLSQAIIETRNVSHELIPLLLQEYGLAVAIADFCGRFSDTDIALSCYVLEERLENSMETAVYRICQELVNNIVKHSGAAKARIEVLRDKDMIIIEAQDNGKGIDLGQEGKGIGLKTIQDRVKLLRGTVEIDTRPSVGTLVTVSLPFIQKNGPMGE